MTHRWTLPLLFVLAFGGAALAVDRSTLPPPLSVADFPADDPAKAKLGQLLFHDKILSGNRNIACGTCHQPNAGSADALSLGIGEGGAGVGPLRHAGLGRDRIRKRIPRNAPGLWNLAHKDVHTFFHDGRLAASGLYDNGFNSPAEERLPAGFTSLLAAQAVLPMTARFEMAGDPEENEVAGAINDRVDNAWPIIAKRVRTIPAYGDAFVAAFDDVAMPEEVTIVHIAEALAAFMGSEWRSVDTPFDTYLAGDDTALSRNEKAGLELFYGRGNCDSCHSGSLLTDQSFHALGLPFFGPGRTRRFDPAARDVGRMGESDRIEDAYRFRTPALRNVALTAPYGHNGAYATLEGIVRHHLDPVGSRARWSRAIAALPPAPWLAAGDFLAADDAREVARHGRALDIEPVAMSDSEISDIVAFLRALTDRAGNDRPLGIPDTVPSGLQIDR